MPNAICCFAILLLSACLAFVPPRINPVSADVESPSVLLDSVPPYLGNANHRFSGTALHESCPIASVEYSCDHGGWMSAQAADETFGDSKSEPYWFTVGSLPDGAHVIRVRATSSSGYTTTADEYAVASFVVDTINPVLSGDPVSLAPISDGCLEFTGVAEDSGSPIDRVEYSIDSGDWLLADAEDGTFDSLAEFCTIRLVALSDGAHVLVVRAVDSAGNASILTTNTVTVDGQGPDLRLENPPVELAPPAACQQSNPASVQLNLTAAGNDDEQVHEDSPGSVDDKGGNRIRWLWFLLAGLIATGLVAALVMARRKKDKSG